MVLQLTTDVRWELISTVWTSLFVLWGLHDSLIPRRNADKQKINSSAALIDDAPTDGTPFFISRWTYNARTTPPRPHRQPRRRYLTESTVVCFLIKKKNSITLSRLAILVWDVSIVAFSYADPQLFIFWAILRVGPVVTEKISFQKIYFIYYSGYV